MPTPVADLDLPRLAYDDPELSGERFSSEVDALLAGGHWLARADLATLVLDREAGETFLRSRQCRFPGQEIASLFGIADGPLREEVDNNLLHLHGEEHRALRRIVAPFFTPRAADARRPLLRALLEGLWAPIADAGRAEVVAALCRPYPAMAIATVVGAPVASHELLARVSATIQLQFDPPALTTRRREIEDAVGEFRAFCLALLEHKRAEPADDLATALVHAGELTDLQRTHLVLNVLVGGVDTTQAQLAQSLLLAATEERWPTAEESLRRVPITPFTARLCLEDVEVRGVLFPAGTIVLVCAWAANRQGDGSGRMLTFGAGPHHCLGRSLAWGELEEALAFLEPRMPGLRLDGEPALGTVQGIYGVEALPLAWG